MPIETTNPKDAVGELKASYSVVPATVTAEVSLGMLEGGYKYGTHNYRVAPIVAHIYYDATRRHLDQWWEGEDFDSDSKVNLHHISKAIASLTVLRDAMIQGTWIDDRPPKSPKGWMEAINAKVKQLLEAFPVRQARYTHLGQKAAIKVQGGYTGSGGEKPATPTTGSGVMPSERPDE